MGKALDLVAIERLWHASQVGATPSWSSSLRPERPMAVAAGQVERGPGSEEPLEELWHWLAASERLARGLSFAEHHAVAGLASRLEKEADLTRRGAWGTGDGDLQPFGVARKGRMSTGKLVAQAATVGPVRSKAVEDTRPSDFKSFKVTSGPRNS